MVFVPSIEAIEEFKVQSGVYTAEYGMNSGAQVNVAIKSGTNEFHGSFFEFVLPPWSTKWSPGSYTHSVKPSHTQAAKSEFQDKQVRNCLISTSVTLDVRHTRRLFTIVALSTPVSF
jgi:hypothetical protein